MSAIVLAIYVVVMTVWTPRFETNDDTAMMFVVSGISYDHPSPHIPFSNLAIGVALRTLYQHMPSLPWYGLYLYALQGVAASVMLYSVLRGARGQRRSRTVLACAGLFAMGLQLALSLQFTSTAIMFGTAGIILHVATLRDPESSWGFPVFSGLMLGLSSLVRWGAFQASLLVGLPLLVAGLRSRQQILRTGVFLVVAAVVAFGAAEMEHAYYETHPQWEEYHEFNRLRGALHDTPRLALTEAEAAAILPDVGWSANDLTMFRNWFFTDKDIFNRQSLASFLAQTGHKLRTDEASVAELLGGLWSDRWVELLLIGLAFMGLSIVDRGRYILVRLAHVGWVLLLLGYLMVYSRLPSRVSLPILLGLLLCLFVAGHPVSNPDARATAVWRLGPVVAAVGAIVLAVQVVSAQWGPSTVNRANQAAVVQRAEELLSFDPEGVFVSWAGALHFSHIHPLRPVPSSLRRLTWIGLGWRIGSPDFDDHLDRLGIEDVPLAIVGREDVHLVARPRHVALLPIFLEEHHGVTGRFEPVHDLRGAEVHVYRWVDATDASTARR